MKKILVNGLTESAGKTTAVLGLYSHLQRFGEVSLLKPLAANNYWHDYPVVMEGVREGRLYSEDAKLLSRASGAKEEVVNPLHRLWPPFKLIGIGGEGENSVLLDRIYNGEKTYALLNSKTKIPSNLFSFLGNVDDLRKYSDEQEHNRLIESIYPKTLQSSRCEMEESKLLIIESYSKIAIPHSVSDIELVVTVELGRVHLSNGERFEKAESMALKIYVDHEFEETSAEKCLKVVSSETYPVFPIELETLPHEGGYEEYADLAEAVVEHLGL